MDSHANMSPCETVTNVSTPLLAVNDLIYIQSNLNDDFFKFPLRFHDDFRERCLGVHDIKVFTGGELTFHEQSCIAKWVSGKSAKPFWDFVEQELESIRSRENRAERVERGFKSQSDEAAEVTRKLEEFLAQLSRLLKQEEPVVQARNLLSLALEVAAECGTIVTLLFDPDRPSQCPTYLQEAASEEQLQKAFCLMAVVTSFIFDLLADLVFSSYNDAEGSAHTWLEDSSNDIGTLVELVQSFDKHWKKLQDDPRAIGVPEHVDSQCEAAQERRKNALKGWRKQQTDTFTSPMPNVELKCICSDKKSRLWMTMIRSRSYLELALARQCLVGGQSSKMADLLGTSTSDTYLHRLGVATWHLADARYMQGWTHFHREHCDDTTLNENEDWRALHFWPMYDMLYSGIRWSAGYQRAVAALFEQGREDLEHRQSDNGNLSLIPETEADHAAQSFLEPCYSFTRAGQVKAGKQGKTKAGNPKVTGAGIRMDYAGVDMTLIREIVKVILSDIMTDN